MRAKSVFVRNWKSLRDTQIVWFLVDLTAYRRSIGHKASKTHSKL